jgi:hypothetical protein
MKVTELSDVMSTPRDLDEPVNADAAGTEGGGEWYEVSVGVHGFNHCGADWMITDEDVATICGGKISGGERFCTENGCVCSVKKNAADKADFKPD